MMRILFIVPYPELRGIIATVLKHFRDNEKISVDIDVKRVEEVEKQQLKNLEQYDAIIARGYSALLTTERYKNIPTIRLNISSFDILQSVKICVERYHASNIALIVTDRKLYGIKNFENLFNARIVVFDSIRHEELPEIISRARKEYCDAVIGGYSASIAAEHAGIRSVVIQTGEDAVLQALEEAVQTIRQIRAEQTRAEMYKAIVYSSNDGILFVDADGIIRVRNHVIRKMNGNVSLMHKLLKEQVPWLYDIYQKSIERMEPLNVQVLQIPHTKIKVSVIAQPVIVKHEISGVLLNISDITRIQELEGQIRKKLGERGLCAKYQFKDIIHESPIMDEVIHKAQRFAASDANVIIVGETGTGKELFAQSIHLESPRKNGPFVVINCAAVPDNLLESELFGYSEGAFTGASKGGKMGLFEQAHHGTLFLDEIGEIPMATQTKLLRVLQEHQVRRIGDDKVINVDVRIIAATNKNLRKLCDAGKFRRDLMYRLDVLRLFVPPLRERDNDVKVIFDYLMQSICKEHQHPSIRLEEEALPLLKEYPFVGNIRELSNIVERLYAMSSGTSISRQALYEALYPEELNDSDFYLLEGEDKGAVDSIHDHTDEEDEKKKFLEILTECGWNRSKAAERLNLNRSTIWRKMKKYGLL